MQLSSVYRVLAQHIIHFVQNVLGLIHRLEYRIFVIELACLGVYLNLGLIQNLGIRIRYRLNIDVFACQFLVGYLVQALPVLACYFRKVFNPFNSSPTGYVSAALGLCYPLVIRSPAPNVQHLQHCRPSLRGGGLD